MVKGGFLEFQFNKPYFLKFYSPLLVWAQIKLNIGLFVISLNAFLSKMLNNYALDILK